MNIIFVEYETRNFSFRMVLPAGLSKQEVKNRFISALKRHKEVYSRADIEEMAGEVERDNASIVEMEVGCLYRDHDKI